MFRATLWLTLATLLGLAAGFAREWLLVGSWGAGARTDAFLVALFLPEAIRMTMGAGLLGSAALPLYQQVDPEARRNWMDTQILGLGALALLLALLLCLGAPLFARLVGPGLGEADTRQAQASLQLLAWTLPGIMLQPLLAVPLQAAQRFLLAGLGSLLYNLPAVCWLLLRGADAREQELALAFIVGSVAMTLVLLPSLWRTGWRPWHWHWHRADALLLYARLGPLLVSAAASQSLALLERIFASLLGEGAITLVNLARKLVNLPLIALMSLNQVLLGLMSRKEGAGHSRRRLLMRGLGATTLLTLPAAAGMIAAAPVLVAWLLPNGMADGPLPRLLAWFAGVIVFGAWNALLARYAYADGDTATPMRLELIGSAVNAAGLIVLPAMFGLPGIALSALAGCLATGALLLHRFGLWADHRLRLLPFIAGMTLLPAAGLHVLDAEPIRQFALAVLYALACTGLLGWWLRPMLADARPR